MSTQQTPPQPRTDAPGATSSSRRTLTVVAAVVAPALAGGGAWAAFRSDADPARTATEDAAATPSDGDLDVQGVVDSLVDELELPAALAHVVGPDGTTHDYTAGVGDLSTGAEVPVDGEVRIASNTKTFTATVVLQLVGEGSVELDAPIETYLPGLVHGEGIDGSVITVRQLLQHTSGLPSYTAHMEIDPFATRDTYLNPRTLLDAALAHPADFAPGTSWSYSNTGYTVLGLLIEKVTGRPLAEQVTERIIEPLGLEHTYVPAAGERELRDDHPHGYHPDAEGELVDITEIDPSQAGAAGDIVSTPSELAAFFAALIGGELLEPAELEAMQQLVDMPQEYPGDGYGLGLIRTTLSCGVELWGHGGDIQGYATRGGVAEDGQGVVYAVTSLAPSLDTIYAMEDKVDEIVCG